MPCSVPLLTPRRAQGFVAGGQRTEETFKKRNPPAVTRTRQPLH